MSRWAGLVGIWAGLLAVACASVGALGGDPLPAWRDGAAKTRIVDFVAGVTREGGEGYVPEPERVAVFDNDGTLWVEQPIYTQLAFAYDRIRALAPDHPEWQHQDPFRAALAGDTATLVASGHRGILELVMASHTGMTTDEFTAIASAWLASARHPRFERPYPELAYQPMVELLRYLRANGFKTYIVSAGGVEFMRPFTEGAYGIPPEQVIGSSIRTSLEEREGEAVLVRLPEILFVDDKGAKPVAIQTVIGRRPLAAFGNSDGDLAMIRWTLAGKGQRLGMIVHHTDAAREYAYDRDSPVGRLQVGLDGAADGGWMLVDMKRDWERVFAFEAEGS